MTAPRSHGRREERLRPSEASGSPAIAIRARCNMLIRSARHNAARAATQQPPTYVAEAERLLFEFRAHANAGVLASRRRDLLAVRKAVSVSSEIARNDQSVDPQASRPTGASRSAAGCQAAWRCVSRRWAVCNAPRTRPRIRGHLGAHLLL